MIIYNKDKVVILTTAFDLGDAVYAISRSSNPIDIPCKTCNGKRNVVINNSEFICPDCYGHGTKKEWLPTQWRIQEDISPAIVGQINLELTHEIYEGKIEIRYMISSTGVGSGSLWPEEQLFSTWRRAQDACRVLNEEEKAKNDLQ
jgi:hypothetical protein